MEYPLTYDRGTTSTLDLQDFWGAVWLRSTNIDIMMEDLAARVASDPDLGDKVIIAPLAFSEGINTVANGEYSKHRTLLLHRYERDVKENKKERTIFGGNVGSSHWVGGTIDFIQKTIEFGDSFPGCSSRHEN
ncbi:hypothetical protein B0H17DRAFT_1220880 [Mycena rosella]|uniref:Uncharacterized protein n=1 Tax=Mycena rosella TaxID=1033263 RepID=A0AAD7B7F6_MYCRO|nr:hypothetical protein B0H17DRAFT_1220880 [Mycena rosella]